MRIEPDQVNVSRVKICLNFTVWISTAGLRHDALDRTF